MRDSMTQRLLLFSGVVLLLLILKYCWTLVAFPGVPFGYDAGIYRFLFIREAHGWPPFLTPDLPEWAKSHAPGLFFFTSPFVMLGLSPDWLIGWLWNLFPVAIALSLAFVVRRRYGDLAGFFVLLCALVSVVQYQGFLMLYMKVFVAFLFCLLAFDAYERRSRWWVALGMMTIAVHQQIGLVFALAVCSSMVFTSLVGPDRPTLRDWTQYVATILLGAAWYLPTYQRSLQDVLPEVMHSGTVVLLVVALLAIALFAALIVMLPERGRRAAWTVCIVLVAIVAIAFPLISDAPEFVTRYLASRADTVSGSFLGVSEYLFLSWPLLLLGIAGLVFSAEKERGTPSQWAVIWCAVAVIGMFFFYRRFILPLDFFLLPFAARAAAALWRSMQGRIVVSALLLVQGVFLLQQIQSADPHVKRPWLQQFGALSAHVPSGSTIVVLDNMAPWVLGYLPNTNVSGPGIFDSRPYAEWEKFLLGSEAERRSFISGYPAGTFFYASPVFMQYYTPDIQSVLRHPCLTPAGSEGLYRSVCGPNA